MDNEGTILPRLEFARKNVKLGIVEQHLISFMEIFFELPSGYAIFSISLFEILNLGSHHFVVPLTH